MKNRVIALGFFDGVHLGHAALLSKTIYRAKQMGLSPAVLTFSEHPSSVTGKAKVSLINTVQERCSIIRRLFGIEDIIVWSFDTSLMHMPWQEFINRVSDELGASHLVAGYDYRFGFKGEGNAEKLCAYAKDLGIGVDIVDKIDLNGETVSSTGIRALIAQGKMRQAQAFLGHPHCMEGTVRKGVQLGRTLGLPTVNLEIPSGIVLPSFGVYASKLFFDGREHIGVTNIGVRPTVAENSAPNAETHILDYNGDLYGESVRVELHEFLRPERRFESMDALRCQITKDVLLTRDYFSSL